VRRASPGALRRDGPKLEATSVIGETLGSYRVVAKLGAGGMGEVYRATDGRLARDVALKLLPPAFAADPERLARFEREARLLASLNHPHIAHVYGFERAALANSTAVHFLAMELVEGDDLAQRLARGPLPVDDALVVARQIADALEEAHEKGIVHRDLKPANVKLTPDGRVKVLDFGLAKALAGDPTASTAPDLSQSPTIAYTGTQAGIILGTAAYMAPEQARGRPVDKRADIWAFGVVLFEMLSGRRLFDGETVSDILAAVLTRDIDQSALPDATPLSVRRLIGRCLERDPKRRLRDIGEARIALDTVEPQPATLPESAPPAYRRALPWIEGAIILTLAALWLWPKNLPVTDSVPVARVEARVAADPSLRVARSIGTTVVLSPDGRRLAIVARDDQAEAATPAAAGPGGPTRLFVRSVDRLETSMLTGTNDARSPFFSPDGDWIAFFANGKLKKVAFDGGPVVTLADAEDSRGGTWLEDDTIVFAPRLEGGLFRVPAAGGTAEPLTILDTEHEERTHRWPEGLPGGTAIVFTVQNRIASYDDASLVALDLASGRRRPLPDHGFHARYLRSGHLTYVHDGRLLAVPFDADRLEVVGAPVPIIEGIGAQDVNGTAEFSVSRAGLLVYQPLRSDPQLLERLDRTGKAISLGARAMEYADARYAPRGDRIAVTIEEERRSDIWVLDAERNTLTRLTFHRDNDVGPVWSPDGRRIAYRSWRDDVGTFNFFWQRADGTGEPERLTTSPNLQRDGAWHPSGNWFAYAEARPETGIDILAVPLSGAAGAGLVAGTPEVLVASPFQEGEPEFSPDGRWLAYVSLESGQPAVYVRPFPTAGGGRWQVSSGVGRSPRWSLTEQKLFFQTGAQIVGVSYTADGDSFRAERPALWGRLPEGADDFDLDPGGDGVLFIRPARPTAAQPDTRVFVFGILDEVQRLVPRRD
jgi:serine/threonine protein kinase/Tol biopolymer transport system component